MNVTPLVSRLVEGIKEPAAIDIFALRMTSVIVARLGASAKKKAHYSLRDLRDQIPR